MREVFISSDVEDEKVKSLWMTLMPNQAQGFAKVAGYAARCMTFTDGVIENILMILQSHFAAFDKEHIYPLL